jgi:hypothetical protein
MRCQCGEADQALSLRLRAEVMHLATLQLAGDGPSGLDGIMPQPKK